jgi:hypothetical protein
VQIRSYSNEDGGFTSEYQFVPEDLEKDEIDQLIQDLKDDKE